MLQLTVPFIQDQLHTAATATATAVKQFDTQAAITLRRLRLDP